MTPVPLGLHCSCDVLVEWWTPELHSEGIVQLEGRVEGTRQALACVA